MNRVISRCLSATWGDVNWSVRFYVVMMVPLALEMGFIAGSVLRFGTASMPLLVWLAPLGLLALLPLLYAMVIWLMDTQP